MKVSLSRKQLVQREVFKGKGNKPVATCLHCNSELTAGNRFCPNCGQSAIIERCCSSCGQKIESNAKFCGSCGAPGGVVATASSERHVPEPPRLSTAFRFSPVQAVVLVIGIIAMLGIGWVLHSWIAKSKTYAGAMPGKPAGQTIQDVEIQNVASRYLGYIYAKACKDAYELRSSNYKKTVAYETFSEICTLGSSRNDYLLKLARVFSGTAVFPGTKVLVNKTDSAALVRIASINEDNLPLMFMKKEGEHWKIDVLIEGRDLDLATPDVARKQVLLACSSNLKNIATALELFSTDHNGHYPVTLHELTPTYMRTIPACPMTGATYAYSSRRNPEDFEIVCTGRHPNVPSGYPRYTGTNGLTTQP